MKIEIGRGVFCSPEGAQRAFLIIRSGKIPTNSVLKSEFIKPYARKEKF